ncbi:MAG TPA: hypothetical protein PLV25_02020 [Opitutales bacterium]|nr:hypothetical protein [Opitutales bacterium]
MHTFLDTRSPLSRGAYLLHSLLVFAVVGLVMGLNIHFLGHGHTFPLACFVAICTAVMALGVMTLLTLRRMKDITWCPILTLMLYIPGVNLALWFMLVTLPGRSY